MCRFLPYRRRRCYANSVNSDVSRPNATKIVYNVEKCILLNLLKSELRYGNLSPNGSATK